MAYAGLWRKQAEDTARVRLVAPNDPEHLTPSADDGMDGLRDQLYGVPAPALPSDWEGGLLVQPAAPGYEPQDVPHDQGQGVGHGLNATDAQDQRQQLHEQDQGTYLEQTYSPRNDLDGRWLVQVIPGRPGDGESPQTLAYSRREGVDTPGDDGRSRNHRQIRRWYDRIIDRHWYEPDQRAVLVRNAQTDGAAPAYVASPDKLVAPMLRRTPRGFGEETASDGTEVPVVVASTSWGL